VTSASKRRQACVEASKQLLGRSDLFILLRAAGALVCLGSPSTKIDAQHAVSASAKLVETPTDNPAGSPDVPTPHHHHHSHLYDFTTIALSSRARPSHCHALTQNTATISTTVSLRPFRLRTSCYPRAPHGRGVRRLFAPARAAGLTSLRQHHQPRRPTSRRTFCDTARALRSLLLRVHLIALSSRRCRVARCYLRVSQLRAVT
jgi:hypothetical protein